MTEGIDAANAASLICAAFAACGNALANVMQRKASLEQPPELKFGWHFLRSLMQRSTWLIGFAGMVGSFLLQAVALDLGQLSTVELVITLEVPLTLLVASRVFRSPIGRLEWAGIWTLTLGMIILVVSLDPRPGDEEDVSNAVYAMAGGGTVGFIVLLLAAAQRGGSIWRTTCLGAAAGTAFGLTATLIKEVVQRLSDHGLIGVLTTWQTYGAIVTGISGVVIVQWALHTGPLLAAQPGFTLMDPFVSVLWGALVYNEVIRTGVWLIPALFGGAAIVAGVLTLARSPLLSSLNENEVVPPVGAAVSLPVKD